MRKTKILIVDDSVVMRKLISSVVDSYEEFEVVATAANGKIALQKMRQFPVDLITMDLEMPEMDGLQTVREIRAQGKKTPIIMLSAVTTAGAQSTLDTLEAGADDFITKPAKVDDFSETMRHLNEQLIPKINALVTVVEDPKFGADDVQQNGIATVVQPKLASVVSGYPSKRQIDAVLIGSSTGGPVALATLFRQLQSKIGVPVFLVQHMPAFFTKNLADRLDGYTPLQVKECVHGESVEPDTVYIAEGGKHMVVARKQEQVVVETNENEQENYCRPAVDVLFRSAVDVYGGNLLAVILTGMGQDGLRGSEEIKARGGYVIAQNEATSVVWGMPGAVAKEGVAEEVIPIDHIADRITEIVRNF